MKLLKSHKSFDGQTQFWTHHSRELKGEMNFSLHVPSKAPKGALIWLSGLECTEENFIVKSGIQRHLEDHQLMVICPDTSPRHAEIPDAATQMGLGLGASYYVDATTPPFKRNFRMYSYVLNEIYSLVADTYGCRNRISIFGHSMGGHGALVLGLRNPHLFKSLSALAPVSHPIASPKGSLALQTYLGEDQKAWRLYDACELIRAGHRHEKTILIDQGDQDTHLLDGRLKTLDLEQVCLEKGQPLQLRMQAGYDHSYYFVATFIGDHIRHHAHMLGQN